MCYIKLQGAGNNYKHTRKTYNTRHNVEIETNILQKQ